jgi:hypothetical protein
MLSSILHGMIEPSLSPEVAMRTAACILLLAFSSIALADDKPVKWEYAELTYRIFPGRPAGKDTDGKDVPAVPAGVATHWITGADDLTATGWTDLAEQLKSPLKKDSSPESQKIQVLNALGEKGWELVDVQAPVPFVPNGAGRAGQPGGPVNRPGMTTMLFKRRGK